MNASTAIAIVINIAFTICVFFAIPIVMPVSSALGTLLIILNIIYAISVVAQIFVAYNPDLLQP